MIDVEDGSRDVVVLPVSGWDCERDGRGEEKLTLPYGSKPSELHLDWSETVYHSRRTQALGQAIELFTWDRVAFIRLQGRRSKNSMTVKVYT